MKITRSRLKRIIKEEYSKLKRQGLLKEASMPSIDYSLAEKLFELIAVNEEMDDPLDFFETQETFVDAYPDLGLSTTVNAEELSQALNDLIDCGIVIGDNLGSKLRLTDFNMDWPEAESILRSCTPIKEAASYNYEEDVVGQVIEGCKIHAVDNNITHPDEIYALCLDVAKKHGVEDKADYIAQIVHGYANYVLR